MKYRVGIDIGGTTIKAGIVDENYSIISKGSCKTPDTFEKSMAAMKDLVDGLTGGLGISYSDIICVGVGAPSTVDAKTGKLIFSNNTNWKNVPIMDVLRSLFPVPVFFENDANCAVIGETAAGAAKGKEHVFMVTLGTGVGGGIIINGKLFTGSDGQGAEIGHTPLVFRGKLCSCGLRGCLESYASATALTGQIKEAMEQHPESAMNDWVKDNGEVTGRTAFDCAKAGDPTASEVLDLYISYIAAGLGGFINTFRPELIIIGGGISNAGPVLLDLIQSKLPEFTYAADVIGTPEIRLAILGNDAGIIGASCLDTFINR